MRSDRPVWLVVAAVCDCRKVAVTIMEAPSDPATHVAGWDGVDPADEVVKAGDDWRVLVTEVATEMAERTGLPIGTCCTAVLVGDFSDVKDAQRRAIEDEVYPILAGLQDAA
jgi:hypothetical protein